MKNTATDILYCDYTQTDEYARAASKIEKKYSLRYDKYKKLLGREAYENLEATIAGESEELCMLAFKLGIAVARSTQSEMDKLFGSLFDMRVSKVVQHD